jgi:multidrug efflux pump subunit AcrA (membrane-fusion protein)
MNAITSRLPLGGAKRRLPAVLARFGFLNWLLGAALVGAGVGSYFAVAGTSAPAAAVRTASSVRGVVLSTTSATGQLQSAEALSVGFQNAGTITSVAVKPGQHVKRGQILGRVDSTSAQQAMQQAEAALATAQAGYEQTLTGETAAERRQDTISVKQSRQALGNAQATMRQDTTASVASVAQAQRALSVDRGQEKLDLYQQQQDEATYPTSDTAQAAITADKSQLTADTARQQADQQQQLTLQNKQSVDKSNLSQAQTGLQQATSAKDASAEAEDQAQVDDFNDDVNLDQTELNALGTSLQNDGFAITADNTKVTNDENALTALQNDTKTIRADEAKIATDHQSVASAKLTATSTAARDRQSLAGDKMSLQSTIASVQVKQAPPTASTLATARASLVNAQIGVVNAQTTLGQAVLRSPIAGTVADVGGTVGTAESGGGSSAVSSSSSSSTTGSSGSSSAFVTLTGLTGMQLVAGFAETDTAKLRVGQPATVTVDALPSKELAAHIIAISGTATDSSGVVTYNVTFALDRSEPGIKSGMSANVDVVIGEADNVVNVPTAAVTGSGQNASVTVLRNGKQVRVPVVAGLQGDSSTAILSGLKAGEQVVLPSVTLSSSGSTGSSGTGTLNFGGGGRTRVFGGGGGFGG